MIRFLFFFATYLASSAGVLPMRVCAMEGKVPNVETGCQITRLSKRQRNNLVVVHRFADQLINGIRQEDVPEFAKDWYFSGAIDFNRSVDEVLNDKKSGLSSALKNLGCRNDREMEWFMSRVVHLRLAKKSEPLPEILSLIREQIKNIDDAWKRANDKSRRPKTQ